MTTTLPRVSLVSRTPAAPDPVPPLLFLHGARHGAWCWERFVGFFADAGFACHALDLEGHGAEPRGPRFDRLRVRDHVPRLAEALSQITGARPPILVAHSMGGWVAQNLLASEHAGAIAGAVLVTPVPNRGVPLLTSLKRMVQYPLTFARATFLQSVPIRDTRMARRLFHLPDRPEEEVADSFAKLVPESGLTCLDMVLGLSWVRPSRMRRVPILVLGAENDYFFPPECERRLADRLGADYVEFQGLAHNLMDGRRWDEVAGTIRDWILRVGAVAQEGGYLGMAAGGTVASGGSAAP